MILRTMMRGLAGALFVLIGVSPVVAQTAPVDVGKSSTSTAAVDHRALAAHYRAHAVEHDADATRHETIAAEAKARAADDDAWDLARDAAHYAEHSREAAEALRDLAQLHDAIAERLEGTKGTVSSAEPKGCCGKGMADQKKDAAPVDHSKH